MWAKNCHKMFFCKKLSRLNLLYHVRSDDKKCLKLLHGLSNTKKTLVSQVYFRIQVFQYPNFHAYILRGTFLAVMQLVCIIGRGTYLRLQVDWNKFLSFDNYIKRTNCSAHIHESLRVLKKELLITQKRKFQNLSCIHRS